MTRFILKSMLAALTASLVALPLQARDKIQIVGSSTVYPFATVVAEKLGKKTGKTPVIESTGTGGGMKLFCAGLGTGHPDFTNASRAIKSSEKKWGVDPPERHYSVAKTGNRP